MKFDVTLLPHQKQGKYWRGTYKVKSGDTLSKIAKEHHTTISALLALNPNIKSPHEIYQNENIDIVEGNADAIIKLDENMTVKVPPHKKTGTVSIDRKSKSTSITPQTDTTNKTAEPKVGQTKLQPPVTKKSSQRHRILNQFLNRKRQPQPLKKLKYSKNIMKIKTSSCSKFKWMCL